MKPKQYVPYMVIVLTSEIHALRLLWKTQCIIYKLADAATAAHTQKTGFHMLISSSKDTTGCCTNQKSCIRVTR